MSHIPSLDGTSRLRLNELTANNARINTLTIPTSVHMDSKGTTFDKPVTMNSSLTVLGDTNFVSVSNLLVSDNLIKFADGNTTTVLDVGFYAPFGNKFVGLFYDHTDTTWKLFNNLANSPDLDTTVLTPYDFADLRAAHITASDFYRAGNPTSLNSQINTISSNLSTLSSTVSNHISDVSNPHGVTLSQLGLDDTDDLKEGKSNLFYTDTRVRSALSSSSSNLTYNSSTGAFSFSSAPTFSSAILSSSGNSLLRFLDPTSGRKSFLLYQNTSGSNNILQIDRTSNVGTSETTLFTLDQSGNADFLGTVDGRNIATDGSNLDSHIANTSNPHGVTLSQLGLAVSNPITLSGTTVGLGYNTTNLKLTSNQLDTIQNIATNSSPTFAGLILNSVGNTTIQLSNSSNAMVNQITSTKTRTGGLNSFENIFIDNRIGTNSSNSSYYAMRNHTYNNSSAAGAETASSTWSSMSNGTLAEVFGLIGHEFLLNQMSANQLLYTNSNKYVKNVTLGTSLSFSAPTLNTIQDIRTTAVPTFARLNLTTAPISDNTLAVQTSAAASTDTYYSAHKAGAYAALFGYSNGGTMGTGAVIRNAQNDASNIMFYVNNNTKAAEFRNSGVLNMQSHAVAFKGGDDDSHYVKYNSTFDGLEMSGWNGITFHTENGGDTERLIVNTSGVRLPLQTASTYAYFDVNKYLVSRSAANFTSDVRSQFSAGTGVGISSGAISIGQAVGTSNSPEFKGMKLSDATASTYACFDSSKNIVSKSSGDFTSDVRSQFSAGTGIDITGGVISASGTSVDGGTYFPTCTSPNDSKEISSAVCNRASFTVINGVVNIQYMITLTVGSNGWSSLTVPLVDITLPSAYNRTLTAGEFSSDVIGHALTVNWAPNLIRIRNVYAGTTSTIRTSVYCVTSLSSGDFLRIRGFASYMYP